MKVKQKKPTLSVVIPVYNEASTIVELIQSVQNSGVTSQEIIVVDDASTDGTQEVLKKIKGVDTLITRSQNGGKGAALREGFAAATGDIVIIQDADLEYDPQEFRSLINPILKNRADVVYGSRFVGSQPHRVVYFSHYLANQFLTFLSNCFNNLNLTDMETGYKAFKREHLQKITLTENSFGIEPELTAQVARMKLRIYEVGISYHGRTYEEGKKIGFPDFLRAVWVIIKFGFHFDKI